MRTSLKNIGTQKGAGGFCLGLQVEVRVANFMMSQIPPDTEHYKPSINIGQAPQLGDPLLYIGTAYVFLIVAAILFVVQAKWVAAGDYGMIAVVLLVHFFTLGFLSMTAMGILTQWVPVVFDIPAMSARQVRFHFGNYRQGQFFKFLKNDNPKVLKSHRNGQFHH